MPTHPSLVSSAPPPHTNDIFDSVVNFEDTFQKQGFQEGFRDGVVSGRAEGREIGLRVGFQQGEELGFFGGCVDIWKAAITRCPDSFSARSKKAIRRFEEQLKEYPVHDHKDERRQEMLEAIRARFRTILAMLSVQIQQYPGSSTQTADISSEF